MNREKIIKNNQNWYIAEAALEYFISLLCTDAFLAKLLSANGMSDGNIGIVQSLISFAFVAQLFAVFVKRNRYKRFVTVMSIVNQVMFVLLYMIPSVNLPQSVKAGALVVMFLGGELVLNLVAPYKITWLMSYVPDNQRGIYSANKEIVSLAGGLLFQYAMGWVSDACKAAGNEQLSFVICGITIFVVCVFHTVSLLAVKELPEEKTAEPAEQGGGHAMLKRMRETVGNPTVMKLILVDVIWHLATGVSLSFYGTYKTGALGFSMRYIAVISMAGAVARILFSRRFGRFADKHSWTKLLFLCFGIASAGFCTNIFCNPRNGAVVFMAYSLFYAVSMAGINSGLMNVIFDFVPPDNRPAALGVKYSFGGIASFLGALAGKFIIEKLTDTNIPFLGDKLYPQQLLSGVAFVMCLILLLYMKTVVTRLKPNKA